MNEHDLKHPGADLPSCIVGLSAMIAGALIVDYGADLLVALWGVLSV